MKLRGFQMTMALMVVGLFVLGVAQAYSKVTLRVEVPFRFYVDNKEMPAGQYLVTRAGQGQAMVIKQLDGPEFVYAIARPSDQIPAAEGSSLTFHKYGNSYFLSKVSSGDSQVSGSLGQSKREKMMANELAKGKGNEQQAVLKVTVPAE